MSSDFYSLFSCKIFPLTDEGAEMPSNFSLLLCHQKQVPLIYLGSSLLLKLHETTKEEAMLKNLTICKLTCRVKPNL